MPELQAQDYNQEKAVRGALKTNRYCGGGSKMIILLILFFLIRRCWKDSKEMCGKPEAVAFWVLTAVYFFLMFYFSD